MEIYKEDRLYSKENPINEIWDLLYYSCLASNLDPSLGIKGRTVDLLQYYLDQSHELFFAAISASNKTGPLLQFYSFSILAKVLIVLRRIKNSTESLAQAHGLKAIVRNQENITLSDIEVKIETNGTFFELLKSLKKKAIPEDYSNITLSLRELFDHYINLYDFLKDKSNIMPVEDFSVQTVNQAVDPLKKNRLVISFINSKSVDLLKSIISKNDFDKINFMGMQSISGQEGIPGIIDYISDAELPDFVLEKDYGKSAYIVKSFNKGGKLIPLCQLEIEYLISYLFSNLVRYYPEAWNRLLFNKEILWEIEKVISYMFRSYPNYLLNSIRKQYISIFPPGILQRS